VSNIASPFFEDNLSDVDLTSSAASQRVAVGEDSDDENATASTASDGSPSTAAAPSAGNTILHALAVGINSITQTLGGFVAFVEVLIDDDEEAISPRAAEAGSLPLTPTSDAAASAETTKRILAAVEVAGEVSLFVHAVLPTDPAQLARSESSDGTNSGSAHSSSAHSSSDDDDGSSDDDGDGSIFHSGRRGGICGAASDDSGERTPSVNLESNSRSMSFLFFLYFCFFLYVAFS
jgi:prophage DNA circulation protein